MLGQLEDEMQLPRHMPRQLIFTLANNKFRKLAPSNPVPKCGTRFKGHQTQGATVILCPAFLLDCPASIFDCLTSSLGSIRSGFGNFFRATFNFFASLLGSIANCLTSILESIFNVI